MPTASRPWRSTSSFSALPYYAPARSHREIVTLHLIHRRDDLAPHAVVGALAENDGRGLGFESDFKRVDLQMPGDCRHKERARIRMPAIGEPLRSEEHTSELQSLMRISYAVFCLKKKTKKTQHTSTLQSTKLQQTK